MSEEKSHIHMFAGMAGGREINLDIMSGDNDAYFKNLVPDEMTVRDSSRQDLVCLSCQHNIQNKIWSISCGACLKQDYPRTTIITGCLECGGEKTMLMRYREHVKTHRRIY